MNVIEFPKKAEAAEPVVSPEDALKMLQVSAAQMVADAESMFVWKKDEGETTTVFLKVGVSLPTETALQWMHMLRELTYIINE